MTRLTAELTALRELDVPALNHEIDISPHAAARLWSEGVPLPEESDGYPSWYYPSPGRILRSADGKWVIRRQEPSLPEDTLSIHETVAAARSEFERLQSMGIDVISRGMTTSPMANTILTVSPWIPDLELCDDDTFAKDVQPLVTGYFKRAKRAAGEGVALRDITHPCQYSLCEGTGGKPFLHDPDPELVFV